jgi:hypothetical protein
VARCSPLGLARKARGRTSLEANGRPCRVGGDAGVRNRRVRDELTRQGIPSTPAPPRRGKGDLLPFARFFGGEGLGRATLIGVCDPVSGSVIARNRERANHGSFFGFPFLPTGHSCQVALERREGVGSTLVVGSI